MPMTNCATWLGRWILPRCVPVRAELVSRLGYAEQKTLTGGIELDMSTVVEKSGEAGRARWKSA